MKTIISTLLTFMLALPAWAEESTVNSKPVGPEATLNAGAHYLDSVFANALQSLELIASTPEAKSGNWKGIKPYLTKLETNLPGVYFFVLPDGNYYSIALDYTNLNLSDRPYFKSLFAGKPVKGFPIYSRSSGKKSALVAAPIIVNGKVTGALGISIFLDDLADELVKVIAVPHDYNWFVLNADATDMLDSDSDFIFMNALKQGSPSLKEAVTKALSGDRGTIEYELDRIRRGYYQKLPNMDWRLFLVKVEGRPIPVPPKLKLSLDRFVPLLQNQLNQYDSLLAKLIEKSNVDVDNESEIRKLLRDALSENLQIVEAAYIDGSGVMRYIEPSEYKNFENEDISLQAHIVAMRQKPSPQFIGGFMTVERFLASIIARPLFDRKGHFSGSIHLVIRPEILVDSLLKSSAVPEDYELWIMQPDGMIIYDQDKSEIGKNLFSDPMYADHESLLKLGKKISSTASGEGSYIFLAPKLKDKVIKKAIWRTVGLHNGEWRVVLAYRPYE